MNRRTFIKGSLLASTGGAMSLSRSEATAASSPEETRATVGKPESGAALPRGRIGALPVSRLLLGGNLLTHYTHSRDLRYVYNLAAHYNTEEKILETLAVAETHGVDTLVIHTVPETMRILRKHRDERGGKIRWIICPTAPVKEDMAEYRKQVEELVADKVAAIYLWGVRADDLTHQGRLDLVAKAVNVAKEMGVPSGVGAHDLEVIRRCEGEKVDADFYIKTLHHHRYPSAPKPEELTRAYSEVPGYWCKNPEETVEFMAQVEKPWIAFKVMAAGAIPPRNAFRYAYGSGADHVLAGMFDFEIEEDVQIAREALAVPGRKRAWRS